MSSIYSRPRHGVVIELDGNFWGSHSASGHGEGSYSNFGDIDKASVFSSLEDPTHAVYEGSPDVRVLKTARVLPITIITHYIIEE